MKKILNYILICTFISFAYNCEEDVTGGTVNYVSFESGPVALKVEKDATTTKDLKVYAGNVTGSDRTFTVLVDDSSTLATAYSVPSTVTIPANTNEGTLSISITDDNALEYEVQTLVLSFMDEAGVSLSDALTINVAELCPGTIAKLSLTFDDYPDEASWELYDLSGTPTVVFSGGPFDTPNTTIAIEFCLTAGMYGIVVYDSYGDGGTSYSVTDPSGAELAAGTTPDAGGGYPVLTQSSDTFTID